MTPSPLLITLLGPTAVGKTTLAARLSHAIGGEIISADSRQVFRGMDLGTGKDISDYLVEGASIPYHLIDIADAGTEYSVYSFIRDFEPAYNSIIEKGKVPVLCGGTGLYLEAVLKGYDLIEVPENYSFRLGLQDVSDSELLTMLKRLRPIHNTTDSLQRDRIIRALEIESFRKQNLSQPAFGPKDSLVFGLRFERQEIRRRITQRLTSRLENGMVEEVEQLLKKGVSTTMLKYYGLEYKYLSMYLLGELSFDEMFGLLNTAIHQFAKRQMTWFRRMERNGINIHWLEGEKGLAQNLISILTIISKR